MAVAHICTHVFGVGTIEHFWVYMRHRMEQSNAKWKSWSNIALNAVKTRSLAEYAEIGNDDSFLEPVY